MADLVAGVAAVPRAPDPGRQLPRRRQPAVVLAAALHADGLRNERRHGLDPDGEREPMGGGAAACLAQPDRAGGVRCRNQGGAGQSLCYGRVRGRTGGDNRDCGVGVVAAGVSCKAMKPLHPT